MADEIAYYSHDLDDGMEAGLLESTALEKLTLWHEAKQQAIKETKSIVAQTAVEQNRKFILRCLINRQVEELITASREAIKNADLYSVTEVRMHPKHLICFSEPHKKANLELRSFLYKYFYRHPSIAATNKDACQKIERLFNYFEKNPQFIGDRFFERIEHDGKHRAICDYIAGMTDRYLNSCFEGAVEAKS
jgi:dGTPase